MKNLIKRDPETLLPSSLRYAKEYLSALCRMQNEIDAVQESKELTIIHRALWKALIVEVGCLFDTYSTKDTISFKKLPHLKNQIDKYHGEAVVRKIIETRNTFSAHFARDAKIIILAPEICDSNLAEILDEMSHLSVTNETVE